MKINIHGKNLKVTDSIKNYIEEKIGKIEKYFENFDEVEATVVIKVRDIYRVVEVTIPAKKIILRAEVSDKDLYAAIDLAVGKLERQIRKNKTKMSKRNKVEKVFALNFEEIEEEHTEEKTVVKRKVIEMKPMSEEEAILQMELLGHDFFAFKYADTGNISVIYKRNDGNYGIMDLK